MFLIKIYITCKCVFVNRSACQLYLIISLKIIGNQFFFLYLILFKLNKNKKWKVWDLSMMMTMKT